MSSDGVSRDTPPGRSAPVTGTQIDQYRILRLLGKGGMGRVFLARDGELGRKVALKLIQNRVDIRQFVKEARATARFNHPHIVTLYSVGVCQGSPYLVLEYLAGQNLRERLKTHPPVFGEAIEIAATIASALAEAHLRKIAHLDLKPANIIIPADGRLRVLDFGLAQTIKTSEGKASVSAKGTPAYMAPEQWAGERVGTAADIWAFGMILYEMLAGRRPFRKYESSSATLKKAVMGDVPVPLLDLPDGTSGLVASCLQRDPELRPTAPAVEAALQDFLQKEKRPVSTRGSDRSTCPFPGLMPFSEAQSDLFFGRETEVVELTERLRHQPVVPVVGTSGVGKSSLVRAGLIPRLSRRGGWQILQMRPGPRPFESLRSSFESSEFSGSSDQETPSSMPPDVVMAHPERLCFELEERAQATQTRFLLFVDQMEEIFTLGDDPQVIRAFLRAILSAADDPQGPVRVIFTIRADYFARATELFPALSAAFQAAVFLQSPGRAALIETLVGPMKRTEFRFDDALVERMVNDAGKQAASLPLLQFTARQLWEARDQAALRLTQDAYDRMGGVAGALIQHGDQVLDALGAEDISVARDLLLRLVTSEYTRRVAPVREVLEGLGPHAQRVLDALVDARLVTTVRLRTSPAIELAHESLIHSWRRLRGWVDAQREDLKFLAETQDAAEIWVRRGRLREEVWTQEALAEAVSMLGTCTLPIPSLVREFIDAGRMQERRRTVRRRGTVAAIVLVSLIMSSVLFVQRRRAEAHAMRAEANAATAENNRARAQREAAGARNASRLASATLNRSDPTLVLALVREMEGLGPLPPQWRELARWATHQTIAEVVLTHDDTVYFAAFSPDGTRIVTASNDQTAKVWPADGTKPPLILRGHKDDVYSASFSPDGTRIVTASNDKTARIWPADGGAPPIVLQGHQDAVHAVAWSPDGKRVATASFDKTVRVWSADGTGTPFILQGHQDRVYAVSFSPDGTRIVTASRDKTARVWSADGTGTPLVLRGHDDAVWSASFSPDGTRIATVSYDKTVRVWSADGAKTPRVLRGHQDRVYSASFSPDGTRLVTASWDKTVRIWPVDGTGTPLILRGHTDGVFSASFSRDGTRIVTASRDKTVRVWRARDSGIPVVLRGHLDRIPSASFSPDGTQIVTASYDKTARVWSVDGAQPPRILRGHQDRIWSASFSPDGTRIVTASWDKTARVWPSDGAGAPLVLRGHEDRVFSASFSPDGTQIVTASYDKTVRVWPADGTQAPRVLRGHENGVFSASFSPDGRRIASASSDKTARVWFVDGSQPPVVLPGHQDYVISASFSPDGTRLVTASFDKTARIWRLDRLGPDRKAPFVELLGHQALVASGTFGGQGAFSPDGARVVTISGDKTLRIWGIDGAGTPAILRMASSDAISASFSPDGTHIVTTSHSEANSETGKTDFWATVWRTFKPLTGLDDPELWTATRFCPSAEMRVELLGVSYEQAQAQRQRCQRRVAAAFARADSAGP